jgi:hypothetical protein
MKTGITKIVKNEEEFIPTNKEINIFMTPQQVLR